MKENHPKLGNYVQGPLYKGRVTAIHHSCPQDDEWLAMQALLSHDERNTKEPWLSVLVHGGGSVVIPAIKAVKIEPFEFDNPWATFYFDV